MAESRFPLAYPSPLARQKAMATARGTGISQTGRQHELSWLCGRTNCLLERFG